MRKAILLTATLASVLLQPDAVRAQFVSGVVVHAQSGSPLDAVNVELRSTEGRRMARALTDSAGRFYLQAPRTGTYSITAERIGLSAVSSTLMVGVSEEVEIVLRMAEAPLALEPLSVEARSHRNIGPLAGYYERVERNQRVGLGNIITRDRIDERNPGLVTDLMREMPRIEISTRSSRGSETRFRGSRAGSCSPRVFVDGVLANRSDAAFLDDLVHPLDLEGLEVYQGLTQMPGEFVDISGCGVVLLWTRRVADRGAPFSLRRLLAAAGIFGLLLLIR
jgi:hypothetical protein